MLLTTCRNQINFEAESINYRVSLLREFSKSISPNETFSNQGFGLKTLLLTKTANFTYKQKHDGMPLKNYSFHPKFTQLFNP